MMLGKEITHRRANRVRVRHVNRVTTRNYDQFRIGNCNLEAIAPKSA
jgi:tRNA U54 and U55 pseudouridine synthase Pus10